MREIKFRAWGNPLDSKKMSRDILECMDGNEEGCGMCFEDFLMGYHEVMQFTGLKDKNGKEIYEGDIVRQGEYPTDNKFVVSYGRFIDLVEAGCAGINSFGWYLKDLVSGMTINLLNNEAGEPEATEVIGNIYENPELLEVKK